MFKKIIIVFSLLLITSCGVNKKNLYKLTINDEDIYVGYSNIEEITSSFDDIKIDDKGIITEITMYPKDYDSPIYINDIEIDSSIATDLLMFKGYESNGACVVEKKVSGSINRIIFFNNIFNDDLDELDYITIVIE